MKLARIATDSGEDFAVATPGSRWLPLRTLGLDLRDTPELVRHADEAREAVAEVDEALLANAVTDPHLHAPILRPGKMIGIGLNYLDHIRESKQAMPEHPFSFAKYASSIVGPTDEVVLDPDLTGECDWEAELAVVIGRDVRAAKAEDAMAAVFGYLVANDVSARDWQYLPGQFSRSKSFDTFCPLGPWITTADEVSDPQALGVRCTVNGEVRQDSSTKEMLYPIAELIAFLSSGMTLEPGDVILTGTPHGVGLGRVPPSFLAVGDEVVCEVEGLGRISNRVVSPRA